MTPAVWLATLGFGTPRGVGETRARRRSTKTRRLSSVIKATDKEEGATTPTGASFRCVQLGADDVSFDNLPGACAAVRTRSFYEFEEDADERSSFETRAADADDSTRLPVDIKARLEWWSDRILSEKLRESKFQRMGMRVITFAALVPSDSAGRSLDFANGADAGVPNRESAVDVEALRRWSVVTATATTHTHHIVVGTMDVHIGESLIGQSLVGRRPLDADSHSAGSRAYAFNVCVAPEFRGLGVAESLFAAAIDALASDHPSVRALYVHVEIDNAPAIRAYEKARFVLEATEAEVDEEPGVDRTRRALLYRDIP
jgi:ribosomal protein S18 acetylase RimI-like enzyme